MVIVTITKSRFLVEINLSSPHFQLPYVLLKDIDLELADDPLKEVLQAVVRVAAPIDVVVHLLQRQLDGRFHRMESQFAAGSGQVQKLVLMVVLVHVDGQRFDHLGQRGEAIAIAMVQLNITKLIYIQPITQSITYYSAISFMLPCRKSKAIS